MILLINYKSVVSFYYLVIILKNNREKIERLRGWEKWGNRKRRGASRDFLRSYFPEFGEEKWMKEVVSLNK